MPDLKCRGDVGRVGNSDDFREAAPKERDFINRQSGTVITTTKTGARGENSGRCDQPSSAANPKGAIRIDSTVPDELALASSRKRSAVVFQWKSFMNE